MCQVSAMNEVKTRQQLRHEQVYQILQYVLMRMYETLDEFE